MKNTMVNRRSRTGKKVHGCDSYNVALCGRHIDMSYYITGDKITCLKCLKKLKKVEKTLFDTTKEQTGKHEIIIVCLHGRTAIVLDRSILSGEQFNVDRIIDMVCLNGVYWIGHEVTRSQIKRVYIATVNNVFEQTT